MYEMDAHERHHNAVFTSEKLRFVSEPRVSELGASTKKVTIAADKLTVFRLISHNLNTAG